MNNLELAKEWEGYINGLVFAGNRRPRIPCGDEGAWVLNDLRDQINTEIKRAEAIRSDVLSETILLKQEIRAICYEIAMGSPNAVSYHRLGELIRQLEAVP